MPDAITLTIIPDATAPFTLATNTSSAFVLTANAASPVVVQLGTNLIGNVNLTGPSSVKGIEAFVGGSITDGEVIVAQIAPYAFAANVASSHAVALEAPLTDITFIIKKTVNNITTQIGTVIFLAGETNGTLNFTSPDIAKSDLITIITPASPDTTIADIAFLVAE